MRQIHFWVAPSTLIFHNVWDIVGSLHSVCLRSGLKDLRPEAPAQSGEPCWRLEGRDLDLRFQASGYTLQPAPNPRVTAIECSGWPNGAASASTRSHLPDP